MQNLARHPLIKIIGIALILYYGLFNNKKHPDGLGNRLSTEKMKSNLSEASKKTTHILTNLKKAEEVKQTKTKINSIKPKNKTDEQQQ